MAITRRALVAGAALAGFAGTAVTRGSRKDAASILFSTGRAREIPADDDLYGWLIGAWALEVVDYDVGDEPRRGVGEVHFAWVLEGRAVQDVWIMPPRSARRTGATYPINDRYGTTIRAYDPANATWRIMWINPVTGIYNVQVGRRQGRDIVQEGIDDRSGARTRWRFIDIRSDSFHWLGEASRDDGRTWVLGAEFFAKRLSTQPLR